MQFLPSHPKVASSVKKPQNIPSPPPAIMAIGLFLQESAVIFSMSVIRSALLSLSIRKQKADWSKRPFDFATVLAQDHLLNLFCHMIFTSDAKKCCFIAKANQVQQLKHLNEQFT